MQLLIEDIDHLIPLRRIIPGNSKPNNPRLAEILKVFDRWEGKGLGMSTLTNECLAILLTKDNNHLGVINTLEDSGLISRHSKSNALYPVYILNRELFKKDFITELRKLFGFDFDVLTKEGKEVLTSIYEFNNYSKEKYPSANIIGNTLWVKAGNANVLNGFEDFKRRIRKIVNQMEKRGIIKRVNNKALYEINSAFVKRPSIYDDLELDNRK